MALAGDRSRFGIEIGRRDSTSSTLRTVDVWLDGRSLCCDDNTAYVPQFKRSIQDDVERIGNASQLGVPKSFSNPIDVHRWLRSDETDTREDCGFMHWGPTTDNLIVYLFPFEQKLAITAELWRPTHRPAEEIGLIAQHTLREGDLISVLVRAIELLD